MKNKKILIVEDNIAEAIHAQAAVVRAGYTDCRAVTNLHESLEILPMYDFVLSDLFFPSGTQDTQSYSARFSPLYASFKERRFPLLDKRVDVVKRAVAAAAELFEVTPQEYVEKIMPQQGTSPKLIQAAQDALAGRVDSARYERFLGIEQKVKSGELLPLGIILAEHAKERGKPVVIVTSTYHHDDAFEPITSLLPCSYVDTLVDNRKNWTAGIAQLEKTQ